MTHTRLVADRYQVNELLGRGEMAEVFRARDLQLGRDVAIKMLRADLARDATFRMRFRREAQNALLLNHPAIVAVYDTGEEPAPQGEAQPYIVMELVSGRTLKEVLAAEGRLRPQRALTIAADICAGLDFSHRHGVIQRDVQPANVMLTRRDQVKVLDSGITRALTDGGTTMTQTGAVIGTVEYLSPEQARGEQADARSDVYATGCVLYELLTGHPPFRGNSLVDVALQHVREDPPPPSHWNVDVRSDVDRIVLKALSKSPLDRYQSAAEMRVDLLRAAGPAGGSAPAAAYPSPPAYDSQAPPPPGTFPTDAAPPFPARSAPPMPRPSRPRGRPKRRPSRPASALDRVVEDAVRAAVTDGRVIFDVPGVMRQGSPERVRVAIARSLDLDRELQSLVRGNAETPPETIRTSPFMAVELSGTGFEISRITPFTESRQLVAPTAVWDFEVLPLRAGLRQLLISVALRVPMPGRGDEQVAVPVLERLVRVRVDMVFTSHRFIGRNWQWLAATGIGLGGAIAAWQKLFQYRGDDLARINQPVDLGQTLAS
jgi:serine/threonine protein kinase